MSRVWEREVSAQIREAVGRTPLVAVAFDRGAPFYGPLDGVCLAAGRLQPTPDAPLAYGKLPYADATQPAILVSFVGTTLPGEDRERLLIEMKRALVPRGRLLVVDHNRPRRRLAAMGALIAAPVPPGRSLGARWRRLGHTTAREAQAAGFVVDALRLAGGERVQVVIARVADAA